MNENISIKSKAGNVIFQLPASEIENAAKKRKCRGVFLPSRIRLRTRPFTQQQRPRRSHYNS